LSPSRSSYKTSVQRWHLIVHEDNMTRYGHDERSPTASPGESHTIRTWPQQRTCGVVLESLGRRTEIYASSRSPGGSPKISVHASGQIHFRLEGKLKQDLAPLMPLGSGPWLQAFELRFLLSELANAPFRERESLKNKSAFLIPVPSGFLLCANLILGRTGTPND